MFLSLLSGFFIIVLALWVAVAVKCESVGPPAERAPTDEGTAAASEDVGNDRA